MEARISGVVLDASARSFGGKDGKEPFRFTELRVFHEGAATLTEVRVMNDYPGSIPAKGEVVDLLVSMGAYQGRVNASAVRPWPADRPAVVPAPAHKSA